MKNVKSKNQIQCLHRNVLYVSMKLGVIFIFNFASTFASGGEVDLDGTIPPSPISPETHASSRMVPNAEQLCQDRPLNSLSASIKPTDGDLPPNLAASRLSQIGVLFDSIDDSRPWMVVTNCEWDAPATRHLPLLFEEPNLERLGYHYRCHIDSIGFESDPDVAEFLQPLVSAAHFVGRIPFIPYAVGVQPPLEPVYTLGVDRPGSPVYYRSYLIPFSLRGTLYQAGAFTGLAFAIP